MRNFTLLFALVSSVAICPTITHAQTIGETASALGVNDPEYEPVGIMVGGIRIDPSLDLGLHYDDNVYAQPTGGQDDVLATIVPRIAATHESGNVTVRANAEARIRRYFKLSDENSVGARVDTLIALEPRRGERLSAYGAWTRAIEDRGDPEARGAAAAGPRETDIWTGRIRYHRARGKFLFDAGATVRKYDARSSLDDDRDFTSYLGKLTVGRRISGSVYGTATAFVTRRNFRLDVDNAGIDRDATTYGGRMGLQVDPGGVIEGNASIGLFRFKPDDAILPARTGLSAKATIIYRPLRRTAIVLDAFRGDVATFRTGATSRTDTRFSASVQQEIRHNLFGEIGANWRETKFFGSEVKERTVGGFGKLEYMVNRVMSFTLKASYASRDSDNPAEEFDRFRTSLGVRLQF